MVSQSRSVIVMQCLSGSRSMFLKHVSLTCTWKHVVVNLIFSGFTKVILYCCYLAYVFLVCMRTVWEYSYSTNMHSHTQMFKESQLVCAGAAAVIRSCCIIIPLITLTCNRVTTLHRQTRPSSGILPCPFSLLIYLFHLLCSPPISWSCLFSSPPLLFLFVSRQAMSLVPRPLLRFLISVCAESREAEIGRHTVYSVSFCLSL